MARVEFHSRSRFTNFIALLAPISIKICPRQGVRRHENISEAGGDEASIRDSLEEGSRRIHKRAR